MPNQRKVTDELATKGPQSSTPAASEACDDPRRSIRSNGASTTLTPLGSGRDQAQALSSAVKNNDDIEPANIQNKEVKIAPLKGIKLSHMYNVFTKKESFPDDLRFGLKYITLAEFLETYLPNLMKSKPPNPKDVSYSVYLEQGYDTKEYVGEGEVFIACERKNNFIDTMNTLKDHFRRTPDIHVCIDTLTHSVPKTPAGDLDINLYESRIKELGYVVVVMSPWNNISFFRRTAVLFEVYSAIKNSCKVDVALSLKEKERLIERVQSGGVKIIQEALEWIDFAKSESTFESLQKLVQESVKPHDVANLAIINVVRDCLTSISNSSEYDIQPNEYTKDISALRLTMKATKDLKGKLLNWERMILSLDSNRASFGEAHLAGLYEALKLLIFCNEKAVLERNPDSNDIEFLNKDVFKAVMAEVGVKNQSIFSIYSDVIAGVLGKRHPMSLKFHDLHIYSLFLSTHLAEEKHDALHEPKVDAKLQEEKLQEAEDKLYQLMMLWESEIDNIKMDGTTSTITFKTALPLSYYRYMYKSKNSKLLLLCLNNTEYGGAWRITWIGISRTMVRCVCTSVRIASDDIPKTGDMKFDWEMGETFKRRLTIGTMVMANFKGLGTWFRGEITSVNLNGTYGVQYDDRRKEDNVSAAFVGVKLSTATYDKFVYLQKRRDPPESENGKKWFPQRAFFAPIPKLFCSCTDYTLLGVDLVKQTFQADAVFEFRLKEIGKDLDCERYVQEYLSRYGFDLNTTIDFRDEIISGSGRKAAGEQFILYDESSSKSFMYDYTIQWRKQSEYTANGLELHNFPFDQQKLSLSISLNSSKLHIEMGIDEKFKVDDSEPCLYKLKEKRIQEEMLEKGKEYTKMFYDRDSKKPWMELKEKKSRWQVNCFIFVQRRFSFYVYSTVLPMLMFCLLSFLTFGVMNDCSDIDTPTRSTITLTLLLSAVAFKVSVSAFLPQVPYFTFLDSVMWLLTSFISVLAVENIAWPAATCTNLKMNLGHEHEVYVMYGLLFLLVTMVAVMSYIAWEIVTANKLKVLPGLTETTASSNAASRATTQSARIQPESSREINSPSKRAVGK